MMLILWNGNRFRYSGGNFVRRQGAKKANTQTYSTDKQRRQRAKGPANCERNYRSRGLGTTIGREPVTRAVMVAAISFVAAACGDAS